MAYRIFQGKQEAIVIFKQGSKIKYDWKLSPVAMWKKERDDHEWDQENQLGNYFGSLGTDNENFHLGLGMW